MDITLKKRIVGFLLLLGVILIAIPIFFGRSIPTDELKLSGHVPTAPPKPADTAVAIPSQSITIPNIAKTTPPTSANPEPSPTIAFEQVQSNGGTSAVPQPPALAIPASANSVGTTQTPIAPETTNNTVAPPIAAPVDTATPTPSKPVVAPVIAQATAADATPITTSHKTASTRKTASKSVKKVTNSAPLPPGAQAWAVQLGSFTDKSNAERLVKKLQAQGFIAYLRTTQTTKGNFVRVLVGPNLQRSDAQQLQTRLQKAVSIDGIIVKAGA